MLAQRVAGAYVRGSDGSWSLRDEALQCTAKGFERNDAPLAAILQPLGLAQPDVRVAVACPESGRQVCRLGRVGMRDASDQGSRTFAMMNTSTFALRRASLSLVGASVYLPQ